MGMKVSIGEQTSIGEKKNHTHRRMSVAHVQLPIGRTLPVSIFQMNLKIKPNRKKIPHTKSHCNFVLFLNMVILRSAPLHQPKNSS